MNKLLASVNTITELCQKYEQAFSARISQRLKEQLAAQENLWDRHNFSGHLTASAIVLNDQSEVLLIKHKFLGLWLAPGGHAGPYEMPAQTAAREMTEETGLEEFELHPWHLSSAIPVDIDTHPIPENAARGEAAHFHHDFRYVFALASSGANLLRMQPREVDATSWRPIDSLQGEYPRVHQRLHTLHLV